MLTNLMLGVVLSLGIAVPAQRLGMLTGGGTVAAVVVGSLIFGFGGWRWAALLFLFFATSSVLTRWHRASKPHPEHQRGRSADQVLANGVVATALAVWFGLSPSATIAAAFAGAIAAATADTWATEIGLLSRRPPRLITTGRIVAPGHSGGVTWMGTAGGLTGAALISVVAELWLSTTAANIWAAGSLAMILDSVLGASVEGRARGVDNNSVNLVATAAGAVLAVLLHGLR